MARAGIYDITGNEIKLNQIVLVPTPRARLDFGLVIELLETGGVKCEIMHPWKKEPVTVDVSNVVTFIFPSEQVFVFNFVLDHLNAENPVRKEIQEKLLR